MQDVLRKNLYYISCIFENEIKLSLDVPIIIILLASRKGSLRMTLMKLRITSSEDSQVYFQNCFERNKMLRKIISQENVIKLNWIR